MDIIAPQTKELWEKSCCIEQSWYRTAEEMKRHASSLEEENRKLRELFPKILDALDNGSGCTPEVSLEFLQGIPKEVELVVKNVKRENSYAEDERIAVAKELESEKKVYAETQNMSDEILKAIVKHAINYLLPYDEFAYMHQEGMLIYFKKHFKYPQQ